LLDFSFCERIHLIFGTCKLVRWWGNFVICFPITSDSLHSFIYNNGNQVFGLPLQAEVTISKLTEERRSSVLDIKVLQEKLVTSWTTFFSCLGVSFLFLFFHFYFPLSYFAGRTEQKRSKKSSSGISTSVCLYGGTHRCCGWIPLTPLKSAQSFNNILIVRGINKYRNPLKGGILVSVFNGANVDFLRVDVIFLKKKQKSKMKMYASEAITLINRYNNVLLES